MSKDDATPAVVVVSKDGATPAVVVPSKEDMEAITAVKDEDLQWIFTDPTEEGNMFFKKMKANPLVPVGKKLHQTPVLYLHVIRCIQHLCMTTLLKMTSPPIHTHVRTHAVFRLLAHHLYTYMCIVHSDSAAGCLATVGALSYGLLQFKRGNTERSQFAMRLRVFAQGSTVVALIIGAVIAGLKK